MGESLNLLTSGAQIVFSLEIFGYIFVGVVIGMVVGALPGINGVMTIILILPFTYYMDIIPSLLLLIAIFCGSTYGGSISAILFNIPGDPQNACTCLDGYPMTQKGEAAHALGLAIIGSAIGGLLSVLVLICAAPPLADIALSFSTVEYFSLTVLGLVTVSALGMGSPVRGFVSLSLGMLLATIGISPIEGVPRFSFGLSFLQGGIEFIAVMIGAFALGEIIFRSTNVDWSMNIPSNIKAAPPKLREIFALSGTIVRSFSIGTLIGALPGAGATIASFVSYSVAKRFSKTPEKFGTGIPIGVVAPETANNAATGGVMIPLFTLGIPGGAATAVMLGAFYLHGLQPGPLAFLGNTEMIGAVFVGMLITNFLILILGFFAVRVFVLVLLVPYGIQATIISVLCVLGAFGIRNNIYDVLIMLLAAFGGVLLRWLDYPIAPLVLGLVLSPIAEAKFLSSMEAHHNDLTVFLTRPISAMTLGVATLLLLMPYITQWITPLREQGKNGWRYFVDWFRRNG